MQVSTRGFSDNVAGSDGDQEGRSEPVQKRMIAPAALARENVLAAPGSVLPRQGSASPIDSIAGDKHMGNRSRAYMLRHQLSRSMTSQRQANDDEAVRPIQPLSHMSPPPGAATLQGQARDSGVSRSGIPDSVKYHGHWLGISGLSLPGSIEDAKRYGDPVSISAAVSNGSATGGEFALLIDTKGSKLLRGFSKVMLPGSAAIGMGLSTRQTILDGTELYKHPDSVQAKWNFGNSMGQTGGTLLAMGVSVVFPPAALAPLAFPDFAEIHHAVDLGQKENELRAKGLNTEADAVHKRYVGASLNATPGVNWFSSYYRDSTRPAIENFEVSQGNVDGAPPQGELPAAARRDPRVLDYYGNAMNERLHTFEASAKEYLEGFAQREDKDTVTLISRAPQTFYWPSSGQPMRVFDRSLALTYSRKTGSVTGTFFGRDVDGTFRLPVLSDGMSLTAGKKHLVLVTDMFDREREPVKFDLAAYNAGPPGSVSFRDPNGYTF